MKRWIMVLALAMLAVLPAGPARAQIGAGTFTVGPEFGFGIDSNFGITFGGLMTYWLSPNLGVGPVFQFSTAGRKFELTKDTDTAASHSLAFAGRFYYLFNPDSTYPWYVDAGIGIVNYSSIDETDDGKQFSFGGQVPSTIEGGTRFGFSFGSGTFYPINETMNLVIDVNSYVGSHGKPTVTENGKELGKYNDAGSFWHLDFTVGLDFML